jgi:photosystem II stability/assembly factor-like uncharacterized protein
VGKQENKDIERKRKNQMGTRIIRLCALQLIGLLTIGSAFAARPGDFRVIGPGGGGAMFNPTISPHDPQTVLVSCDMTGAYITHNGGQSWRMFNLRGEVHFFVFDPLDPKTIYAQATGLWRSRDSGESWALLYPKPSAVTGIRMSSDHADEVMVADPNPLGTIAALAVDPSNSKILYAAGSTNHSATLFVSRDSGESWQQEAALLEEPRHIWVDPNSPANSRTLFLGGPHGIALKTPSGVRSLNASNSGELTDETLGFDSAGQAVIYATSAQGVFVSLDGGANWEGATLPGKGATVRAIATSLHHPQTAYVSYSRVVMEGKTWMGVAKTIDEGRTWRLVWKESDDPAQNVHDAWISERFGVNWGENPLELAVAEQTESLCYATDLGRTMRTTDGGATWTAVYSRKILQAGWTTTGLDVTTSYGVHFDPFDLKRDFITYTDIGLFRSEDGGASWTSSTIGVPRSWWNTTYWVVFDPAVRGRMWSVNSNTHDLPRPKMWRHRSVLDYKGGVCRSEDGGRTWRRSNTGMQETAATHILLDPKSPSQSRTLYVTAFGRGVYKSTDGGLTWKLKNRGITQQQPLAWRLAQDSNGVLYLLLARRSEDGSIGNANDGAVYKSTDSAETWNPVSLPEGVNAPNGLAIDPDSPERIYLAAWARATGTNGKGGGIYLTENGGNSWRQVLDRDQHVYDVTVDTHDATKLYASGFESSAWHSGDRGQTWTRIPGFNFKWGHRVIVDPADPSKVYVTTFGGSVWHGSVGGRQQPLDITTPEIDPSR